MADSGPAAYPNWWAAALAALMIFAGLVVVFMQLPALGAAQAAPLASEPEALVEDLGRALVDVDRYVVPFEVASVLLLAALIGAVVVARPPEEPLPGEEGR